MAQQTIVRSISGITNLATNITTRESSTNAITTRDYVSPLISTQTRINTLIFNENAVYHVTLDHLNADGKIIRFVEPIPADVIYQDNAYFCRNEDLDIVSMSAKLEDCIKDFQNEILFVWNEYGREDDSKLTNDAKELKRKILRYINK